MSLLPPFPIPLLDEIVESTTKSGRSKTVFQLSVDVRNALKANGVGKRFERPSKKLVQSKIISALARITTVPNAGVRHGLPKPASAPRHASIEFSLKDFVETRKKVEHLLNTARLAKTSFDRSKALEHALEHLTLLHKGSANHVQKHACDRLRLEYDAIKKGLTFSPQAAIVNVNWHILKPGENSWKAVLAYYENLNPSGPAEYDLDRLQHLHGFGPDEIYVGTESFEGYVVMCFSSANLAVLECPYHGNAVYFMKRSEWKLLSQLSKTELLHEHQQQVKRVLHTDGWKKALKKALKQHGLNC